VIRHVLPVVRDTVCPQDGTHCPQDGTEGGALYSQDGTEGGARCPQDGANVEAREDAEDLLRVTRCLLMATRRSGTAVRSLLELGMAEAVRVALRQMNSRR